MIVFVGGTGDTDYESLLTGLHKTIILKGAVECGSEKLVQSEDDFKIQKVVPEGSINVNCIEEGFQVQDISAAIEILQKS